LGKPFYDALHDDMCISWSGQRKDFWQLDMVAGGYIDIYDGILYLPYAPSGESYPERGLLRSQLLMLSNMLEVSVAPLAQAGGKVLTDPFGVPYTDPKTKAPLQGKFGLSYRGKAFLDEELKKIDERVTFETPVRRHCIKTPK
jgi:hypothetical protein